MVLFGPNFIFIDLFAIFNILMATLYIGYVLIRGQIEKPILFAIVFTAIALLFYIPTMIVYNFSEYDLAVEYLKLIVYIISSFFVVKLYSRYYKEKFYLKLLLHIYYSVLIVSFTVILFFVFPELRNFVYPLLASKMSSMWEVIRGIRYIDISVGAGTTLSLVFFVGFVLNVFLLREKILQNYIFTIMPLVFLVSAFLTARSGMFLIIGYTLLVLLSSFTIKLSRLSAFTYVNIFIVIGLFFYLFQSNNSTFASVIPWAFEIFINLIESGTFSTASTNNLFNDHYFFEFNYLELIFGKNYFNAPTDVGYLKILYANGIFGLFVFIIFYLYMFGTVLKNKNFELKHLKIMMLIFLSTILLINIKELIFTNSRGLFLMVLIIYFSIMEYSEVKKGKEI